MKAQANRTTVSQPSRRTKVMRSPEQWRFLIAQMDASPLSRGAFCRQHKISGGSVHKWRKRLTDQPAPPAAAPGGFIDITRQIAAADSASGRLWQVELELGQGVVLRVRAG